MASGLGCVYSVHAVGVPFTLGLGAHTLIVGLRQPLQLRAQKQSADLGPAFQADVGAYCCMSSTAESFKCFCAVYKRGCMLRKRRISLAANQRNDGP